MENNDKLVEQLSFIRNKVQELLVNYLDKQVQIGHEVEFLSALRNFTTTVISQYAPKTEKQMEADTASTKPSLVAANGRPVNGAVEAHAS